VEANCLEGTVMGVRAFWCVFNCVQCFGCGCLYLGYRHRVAHGHCRLLVSHCTAAPATSNVQAGAVNSGSGPPMRVMGVWVSNANECILRQFSLYARKRLRWVVGAVWVEPVPVCRY
jgi:hypothetical protein